MTLRSTIMGVLRLVDSMVGRIFLVLTVGTCAAAVLSLTAAEHERRGDFARIHVEHIVASTVDVANSLARAPQEMSQMLENDRVMGAHFVPANVPVIPNAQLVKRLIQSLPGYRILSAGESPLANCGHGGSWSKRPAGSVEIKFKCWVMHYADPAGRFYSLGIDMPDFRPPPMLDPTYLGIVVLMTATLSALIAGWVAAPIRKLEASARAFSLSLDPEPIPERGPSEVRAAIGTFNLMQRRVRHSLHERTHLLAAISHDLQTPLTRLRLRLEKVDDLILRDRLVADLTATQTLVREGLDLARSSESGEGWSWVDLDSLLASLAEDASEFGAKVTYLQGISDTVAIKPNALIRCLENLIGNAVKYGGFAEIHCWSEGPAVVISVFDNGPGLPEDRLEAMFEPFVRGDESRSRDKGGTGIGLTIARAQARTFGAEVLLLNRPHGGLEARVTLPMQGKSSASPPFDSRGR